MKITFWIGLVVLVLGIASLLVPIPRTHDEGIKAGNVSLGVQVKTEEKLSPVVSGVLIVVGAGLMVAGRGKS